MIQQNATPKAIGTPRKRFTYWWDKDKCVLILTAAAVRTKKMFPGFDLDELINVGWLRVMFYVTPENVGRSYLGAVKEMYRYCCEECHKRERKLGRSLSEIDLITEHCAPSDVPIDEVLDVQEIMQGLTDLERRVLSMRMEGHSHRAIADELGRSGWGITLILRRLGKNPRVMDLLAAEQRV